MSAATIPFEQIQATALAQAPRLLADWFPKGRIVRRKFLIGNIQGDSGESLSINLDTGLWKDFAAGPGGHDLIDLHAAKQHGGDRVAAARDLGASLGLIQRTNGHAEPPPAPEPKQVDDWVPAVPPPADTRGPAASMFSGFDVTYEYTGATDRVTHYVGRVEARGDRRKLFVPITYGTLEGRVGWHKRHPAAPLPLYGLNRLATMPDAPVILCEGEKSADAARMMFPDHACISWCGGAQRADHADLAPLRGRDVIIWPDNDPEGAAAAATIHAKLPLARVVRVDDLGESDDAADVAPEHPGAWLAERLPPDPAAELRSLLSVESWADRDIPPPDRLLGDLVTTTSRWFIVGRTGLGKTMLGFALGAGMASGAGFLHWRSARAARVLIIDGEMPGELIKARAIDALRRLAAPPKPGFLTIYSRDMEEEIGRSFPMLGTLAPLNTEMGQNFVHALIGALGGVDVAIFDNVMSLVAGDQKDEIPWSETLPLVASLTAKRIGQIWLDHTGHATDRQYGSATKAWRFDTVGLMAPLAEGQLERGAVGFSLSFEPPGKARRRTPDNWVDYETCTIRLQDDRWTSDRSEAVQTKPKEARLHDKPTLMLREVRNLIAAEGTLVQPEPDMAAVRAVTRQVLRGRLIASGWFSEHLLRIAPNKAPELTRSGYGPENHALVALKRTGFLGFSRDWVWLV
jgi:hypothetical protein